MKLARVNLEAEVWGDPRFPHLERLLGYPPCSGHLAIARMAMIWGWQVEHYTPEAPCFHAPEEVIEMALEVDGARAISALVRARLAEETPEGIRMKGACHESTGWLWRIRQRSAAGVDAKKEKASAKRKAADVPQPAVDPRSTQGEPQVNPLSSGLSAQGSEIPDLSLGSRAIPPAPPPEPRTFAPLAPLVALAVELLNAARLELDPHARPIAADPGDEMALARHVRGMSPADAEAAVRHGIAAIASAVRDGREPMDKLRPGELLGPRSWLRWQAATLAPTRARGDPAARPPARGKRGLSALLDLDDDLEPPP